MVYSQNATRLRVVFFFEWLCKSAWTFRRSRKIRFKDGISDNIESQKLFAKKKRGKDEYNADCIIFRGICAFRNEAYLLLYRVIFRLYYLAPNNIRYISLFFFCSFRENKMSAVVIAYGVLWSNDRSLQSSKYESPSLSLSLVCWYILLRRHTHFFESASFLLYYYYFFFFTKKFGRCQQFATSSVILSS
jgi:hypothetical protein